MVDVPKDCCSDPEWLQFTDLSAVVLAPKGQIPDDLRFISALRDVQPVDCYHMESVRWTVDMVVIDGRLTGEMCEGICRRVGAAFERAQPVTVAIAPPGLSPKLRFRLQQLTDAVYEAASTQNLANVLCTEYMKKKPRLASGRIPVGSFELHVEGSCLLTPDRTIHLSPDEKLVLLALALNAGRPMSRTSLMDYVEKNQEIDIRLVDVLVSRIRRKIGDRVGSQLIRTVRGLGYIIDRPGTSKSVYRK